MVAIPKPKDSVGFPCFNPTEKRMRSRSVTKGQSRSSSIRVAWPKGQGASHFLSLFPIPCSLLPAPCSLKPKTFYLTQLTITIVQSTLHQNQPQSI